MKKQTQPPIKRSLALNYTADDVLTAYKNGQLVGYNKAQQELKAAASKKRERINQIIRLQEEYSAKMIELELELEVLSNS
jgi:phosphopantetheine adenylyltransferase